MSTQTFDPKEHTITMERKSKKKDAQGRETWEVTKTEYLPVQWRLCWFRLENPKGKIDSKSLILDLERGAAVFETYVEREDGGNARMHGSETLGDWKDYIEKAQTKSLGRSLAACGYGSQFTDDEFAEGESIVDSPVTGTKRDATHDQADEKQNGTVQPVRKTVTPSAKVESSPTPFALKGRLANLYDIPADKIEEKWAAFKVHVLAGESVPDFELQPHQIAQLHGAIIQREKGHDDKAVKSSKAA